MTREETIKIYLINSPKVVAEMLYAAIERNKQEKIELAYKFDKAYKALRIEILDGAEDYE